MDTVTQFTDKAHMPAGKSQHAGSRSYTMDGIWRRNRKGAIMLTIDKGKSGWRMTTFTEDCRTGIYSTLYIILGTYHIMWTRKVENNERKAKAANEGAV